MLQLRRVKNWLRAISLTISGAEGAQIVELAVTLPVLVVVFVGIYDFGQAFNTKQKLTLATREGARIAASQSTSDLTNSRPGSILAVRDVVDAYLTANKVNDCGLGSVNPPAPANWIWQFTATGCSYGNLVLTVDRGHIFTTTASSGNTITVEATQVTLSYPYQWQFNRAIGVLIPGANYAGVTQIQIVSVMQNLN